MHRLKLAALITLGSIALVGLSDLALAPELKADLWAAATAVADHVFVKALVFVFGVSFVLSLCAAAWERSERRYQAELEQRDGARGERPDSLRAPCGELVRLPETKSDSGPIAPRDAA